MAQLNNFALAGSNVQKCVRTSKILRSGVGLTRVTTKQGYLGFGWQTRQLTLSNQASSQQVEFLQVLEKKESSEGNSGYYQALFNCVNILMGVGILSIPYSLKEGGWASLGVLTMLALCTNYTGKILAKCQGGETQQAVQERIQSPAVAIEGQQQDEQETQLATISNSNVENLEVRRSYEDIGEAAFGQFGRQFITLILYTELIGTCSLFFILEGDHLHLLLQSIFGRHIHLPPQEILMGLSAALFVPTTWLPDLEALSYVGAMGMLSALGLTGVVLYNFFDGGITLAHTSYLNLHHLPMTFGLAAFVFAGHAVFPSIRMSMKEKQLFPKVIDTAYVIVFATCVAIGAAGYLMYGNRTLEEVTLNLPKGLLRDAAIGLILVSPFTKFALTLEPVAQGFEDILGFGSNRSKDAISVAIRTVLGIGTLVLAIGVPFFGEVMAVIGSFLTITVSIIFPSLCYLKLFGDDIDTQETWFNYFVITLGVTCAIFGSYTSIHDLLMEMNQS